MDEILTQSFNPSLSFRVLVIDDNPDDRALMLRALNREISCIIATEIIDEDSLEKSFLESSFDLIITDFQLNWSTGLTLLPRLKAHSPECPVLMYTGSGNEEVAVEAMKSGVDDYVLKSPRKLDKLVGSARALLVAAMNKKRAEDSEARLERLLSRLNLGVYRRNRKGQLLSANSAFLRIMGFKSFEEAAAFDMGPLLLDRELFNQSQSLLQKTGKCWIPELRMRRADGSEMYMSLSIVISPEDGDIVEGIFEDITERKNLALALKDKEDAFRQSEKLESIGRLAGGVAHDFNNLLTAINGYSELLLQKVSSESDIHDDLVEIRTAGARAARITRELLAFGRRQMLQNKVVDLNTVILGLGNAILRQLGESIAYDTRLEDSLRLLKVDPIQLENVILNLVTNARNALPRGGRLTIETENLEVGGGPNSQAFQMEFTGPREMVRPGTYVSMGIKDTGIGMDADTLTHIFEPFFTTMPINKGSGLGLPTVYGIVKQSNGYVLVKSAPGMGTHFRILLPAE